MRFWVAAVVLTAACGPSPRTPPNVLLITLDTTRADHLGAYGYRHAQTPVLDRLAHDGVVFDRAIAAAPVTLPAHASLLTGLFPFAHGVRSNGGFSLPQSIPTLATALHDRGYRTGAFVSAFVLDRRYGLARGFDVYDDDVGLERRGDRTASAAAAFLERADANAAPFFAWLHLYDAHDPYDPPSPFRDGFARAPYDGEIAFDDAVLGSLLARLEQRGRLASTLVAVVGDHGESLGEHSEATHAMFVYEATVRVPLILAWPGHLPAGRRVSLPVRGVDVAPTLLDLAGVAPLAGAQGRSLVPTIRGTDHTVAPVYAETYFPLLYMSWAPLRSIEDERWKYIDAPVPELYDLSTDGGELTNLAAAQPTRAAALRRVLDTVAGAGAGAMNPRNVDPDTAAKLAALGYIGAPDPGTSNPGVDDYRPDPKTMIGVFNRLRDANAALQAGRAAEAVAIALTAQHDDARNAFAAIVLANGYMAQGRYRKAIDAYRQYAALVPNSADAHHRSAICYARLGDVDGALQEEDAALRIDPRSAESHNTRGGLLAQRGRYDAALRDLRAAVELAPSSAPLRVGLVRVLVALGRLDEAEAELRTALTLDARNADALAAVAAVSSARGRTEAALAAFEESLALRPDADDVRFDYACALEAVGRHADARREFGRLAASPDTPPEIRRQARARTR